MMDKQGFIKQIRSDLKETRKTISRTTVERLAASFVIDNKNIVKELTELALVLNAREIVGRTIINAEQKYWLIVQDYKRQVNVSFRTSMSVLLQQYSTPAPISFLASSYILSSNPKATYFEPSAGNGLLTIALPYAQTTVNELDDVRLSNLRSQPYAKVTHQDATLPFKTYQKKFDGVLTNPPFGSLTEPIEYDDFKFKVLDHAMCINALKCMKDTGKAALIIGGHTGWDAMGRPQAGKNRIFLNYLYYHYNVEDVISIDGRKLYSRQGTGMNVRLILINGRKAIPNGAAPLKNTFLNEVIDTFDKLWKRVGLPSKDKTKERKKKQIKMRAKALLILQNKENN